MGGEFATLWVKVEEAGARFKRTGGEPLVHQTQTNNVIGPGEGHINITTPRCLGECNIGANGLIEQRRVRLKRSLRVHDCRQRLIVYLDQLASIFGHREALGQQDRDWITDIAHMSNCQGATLWLSEPR